MLSAVSLWTALVVGAPTPSVPSETNAKADTLRRRGRVMLGLLPLSFGAFAGAHAFGFGLRQGWIPCKTPRNPKVAFGFEAVLCIGLPGKVELVAAGAPLTLAALGTNDLTRARLHQGRARWRRGSALAAVVGGSVLMAGGFATVIVSLAAEAPVFRSGEGWGWPYWTHVVVAQSGAALMAGGGAMVGAGAAHLRARPSAPRAEVRVAPTWGPGISLSGRF